MPFGRTVLPSNGSVLGTRVSADGRPDLKVGGITLDLTTIPAAAGTDTTLPDGSVVKAGQQYLRYGQIMTRSGVAEVQTVTFTGGPTTGSAVLTLPASGTDPAQSTAAISATATGAAFQTAITALSRIGPNGATVARTGAGTAGDPYVYTVTFARSAGNPPQFTSTNTFGGGTTPSVTHGTTTDAGTAAGKWGPYDPNATDGRQTLAKGEIGVLDETWLYYPTGTAQLSVPNDIIGGIIVGGYVFKDRILMTEGTASLAAGPTRANVDANLPNLKYVTN